MTRGRLRRYGWSRVTQRPYGEMFKLGKAADVIDGFMAAAAGTAPVPEAGFEDQLVGELRAIAARRIADGAKAQGLLELEAVATILSLRRPMVASAAAPALASR